jgi:hypothetical protein
MDHHCLFSPVAHGTMMSPLSVSSLNYHRPPLSPMDLWNWITFVTIGNGINGTIGIRGIGRLSMTIAIFNSSCCH